MAVVGKFTKRELRRISNKWTWHSQLAWNYERMQGLGYLTAMLPAIEKLYGDNPELKQKALKAHSGLFNTTPAMGNILVGISVAIEEQMGSTEEGIQMAESTKTALMGPFAAVGDTIFGMIPGAVFGSIAATMAKEGSLVGIIIWEVWMIALLMFRGKMFDIGYNQGTKLITSLNSTKDLINEAASVLGLTVVGGMIATMVKFNLTTVNFNIGTDPQTNEPLIQQFPLQKYADSIMPALFPMGIAILSYWLLGKKWMNSNRLILLIILVSIGLACLNIVSI